MTFSFATKKDSRTKLELIESPSEDSSEAAIQFKIISASLSANNKFYLDFGEKPPFSFFKSYPISENAKLVDAKEEGTGVVVVGKEYAHPPIWGLCQVTDSQIENVPVGSVFRAMLPLGTQVQFGKAHVEPTLGNLVIHRPTTHVAYNTFTPVASASVCHPSSKTAGLALTCYPGIITGFGLYFSLLKNNCYDCDTIVVTSASSKVALAFALYMKDMEGGRKVVGYTSESNKAFCESTGLYSEIYTYEEDLPPDGEQQQVVMVEISGRGSVYTRQQSRVKKLLCIGNSSGVPDKESSFASFTAYATIKMMLTMMGGPKWIRSRMNPVQELFLIMDTMQELVEEWGKVKYLETVEEYTKKFCDEASKWMKERKCDKEDSIQSAFEDIIQGGVPPSEYVVIDVATAVEHRK